MSALEVAQRFAALEESKKSDDHNFEHFSTKVLIHDAQRTVEARGIKPGGLLISNCRGWEAAHFV